VSRDYNCNEDFSEDIINRICKLSLYNIIKNPNTRSLHNLNQKWDSNLSLIGLHWGGSYQVFHRILDAVEAEEKRKRDSKLTGKKKKNF